MAGALGRRQVGLGGSALSQGLLLARPTISRRCQVWGVLNVTPDSFSDAGLFQDPGVAIARGHAMAAEGADVIDVGGASSRPRGALYGEGAAPVPVDEELRRVVAVIAALAREGGVVVSVDTTRAEVARAAIEAGAQIVNDVSCGASAELMQVVAAARAQYVLMHTRGQGEVTPENTGYADVVRDVRDELLGAVERAVAAGIVRDAIWLDPGLGFAKTPTQSLRLLAGTTQLIATGHRVLVGASRKGFIADAAPDADGGPPPPARRGGGTAAAVTAAVLQGAHAVRVHDVVEMRQAVLVAQALRGALEATT